MRSIYSAACERTIFIKFSKAAYYQNCFSVWICSVFFHTIAAFKALRILLWYNDIKDIRNFGCFGIEYRSYPLFRIEISSSCTFVRVTLWRYRDEFPRWTISRAWYTRKLDNSYCDASSGRNGNNIGGIVGCVSMLVTAWNSMSCMEYRQRCSRELYRVSNDATRRKRRANCMVHNRTPLSLSL